MIKNIFDSHLNELIQKRNFVLLVAAGEFFVLLILLFIIVTQLSERERIVVVPPEINKTFWVDDSSVSDAYLEQMASYFSQLVLNVTPRSVDKNNEMVLGYTAPAGYGDLKADLLENARKIKEDGITTVFYPDSFEVNAKNLTVLVSGNLVRMISQEKLPTLKKTYEIVFEYKNAKLSVKEFKEIPDA